MESTEVKEAPRYRLGTSDTWLSPIGLGTWQFSQGRGLVGRFWPKLEPALMMSIVEEALRHGINWFDTAEIYGRSEEALAVALDELGVGAHDVAIATKWWPLLRSAQHIEKTILERRRRLHERPIVLYQIHQPYSRSSIAEQMDHMARLLDQGLIRHVGVSNFSAKAMREAARHLEMHGYRLASNQVRYNLLDRRIEGNGILDLAQELGVTIIAYSPLAQGLLTGKFHREPIRPRGMRRFDPHFRPTRLQTIRPLIDALDQLAEKYQVTIAEVALNWVITYPGDRVMAIPGATRVSQAAHNAGAMAWRMSPDERQFLTDLAVTLPV